MGTTGSNRELGAPAKMRQWVRDHLFGLVFFLASVLVYGSWLIAFWPGIVPFDSLDQWRQATTGLYVDASPFLTTLLMVVVRSVGGTLSTYIGIQLIVYCATLAVVLDWLWRRAVGRVWTLVAAFVFLTWPQFGYHATVPLKDVPFTLLVLAIGFVSYRIVVGMGPAGRRKALIVLAILCGVLPAIRYNGFPFLVVPGLTFLALRRLDWRRSIGLIIGSILVFASIDVGLFRMMDVQDAPMMVEEFYLKSIGAIAADPDGRFTPEQVEAIEKILPLADFEVLHTPTTSLWIRMKVFELHGVNTESPALVDDPEVLEAWHDAVRSAILSNPASLVRDRLKMSVSMFGVAPNSYKYQTESDDVAGVTDFSQTHPVPQATEAARSYLALTHSNRLLEWLFWAAWVPGLASLGFWIASVARKRPGTFIYTTFLLIHVATLLIAAPANDYRYVFFLHMSAVILPALRVVEGSLGQAIPTPGAVAFESQGTDRSVRSMHASG